MLRDKVWISKCELCSIVSGITPAPGRSRVRLALDYSKFHRPSADFFLITPRGAGLCARGREHSPGLDDRLKDSLWQKSGGYQILIYFLG